MMSINLNLSTVFRVIQLSIPLVVNLSLFDMKPISDIILYASLMPSIWLWIYVMSLAFMRTILRSERLLNWLRWALPIDEKPFRSVGVVAAALMFVATGSAMAVGAVL
jgi:hypothetical protein